MHFLKVRLDSFLVMANSPNVHVYTQWNLNSNQTFYNNIIMCKSVEFMYNYGILTISVAIVIN